jgi:drug/metabolite transporter (DMT)-like permease
MSVMVNLTPLVTAFWARLLLGERLSIIQTVGMLTVIVGVVLVQCGKT